MSKKLSDYIHQEGPAPNGDLLYVIHDPHSGWSKFGITGRFSNDRVRAIRSRYAELPAAEIVGVVISPSVAALESIVYLELRGHALRRRRVHLRGERFRGVRPMALLRYARLVNRELSAMYRVFAQE